MLLHKTPDESINTGINTVRADMFKPRQITRPNPSPNARHASAALAASLALIASTVISAQETEESDEADQSAVTLEEVFVANTRGRRS